MTPESKLQLNGLIAAHILILTSLSSEEIFMCPYKSLFLCLLSRHHRFLMRTDAGFSSSLLLGPQSMESIQHPGLAVNCYCFISFVLSFSVAAPEGRDEEGLQLSGSTD